MKRTLSVMLTLALILSLCAAASAEVYTHPEAGYGFTVPEGWMAIDGENAANALEKNKAAADFSDALLAQLDQLTGVPIAFLYEKERVSPAFRSNINVTLQDLGAEAHISEILPYTDAFAEGLQLMYPDYAVSTPLTLVELGPWETVLMGGEFTLNGNAITLWQVRLISGTVLYEITLTALTGEDLSRYEETLGAVVATFFAP